jgi:glutamine amidotransferase-like uncharacterized protein
MKKILFIATCFCVAMFFCVSVGGQAATLALIYKGPGACESGCAESAAEVARTAGLLPVFVGPDQLPNTDIFREAAVWIQPGGRSSVVFQHMNPILKKWITDFVYSGASYVGFCAGGFFSTSEIADRGQEGLGIIPGINRLYEESDLAVYQVDINWEGKLRNIYWEGGPYFVLPQSYPEDREAWPVAYYPNGSLAAVKARFGEGRAFVSGPHPEAPESWKRYYRLHDTDGSDWDLARAMIEWTLER